MTPWDLPENIRARVRVDESGCWHYIGSQNQYGHGMTSAKGGSKPAHRVVYALLVGPIPDGYHVDHLCRIPRCCNPEHLEPVTPAENRRRSPLSPENRTHCKAGHPLSGDNVYRYSDGRRSCRTCIREYHRNYQREYRRRKSA